MKAFGNLVVAPFSVAETACAEIVQDQEVAVSLVGNLNAEGLLLVTDGEGCLNHKSPVEVLSSL